VAEAQPLQETVRVHLEPLIVAVAVAVPVVVTAEQVALVDLA